MEVTQKPHLHQDWIDPHAFGIVKALQKGGFTTYLVGGCVRDLLLGIHPKDFDIATQAHPPQVKRLIYMSFIIGKRFRLVLVKRDDQQFEVATFRRETNPDDFPDGTLPAGDNVFGSPEEDAQRRDFTINGLFYDPINEQLIDYVGGLPDIEKRVLRMIGDPDRRLIEDSIRILRGLRLSHKLGFQIEPELRAGMSRNANELSKAVLPRRREEILKVMRLDEPELALIEAFDLDILKCIAPTLHDFFSHPDRLDLFVLHLRVYRFLVADFADPTQIFAWLVYTLLNSALCCSSTPENPVRASDELFQNFMQNELGMYKLEQTMLMSALEILTDLSKVEDFKRRGERRQVNFMKSDGFKLALNIAESDYLLSPTDLQFWRQAFLKMESDILPGEAEGKVRRRRPRRRKPRPGQTENISLPSEESRDSTNNAGSLEASAEPREPATDFSPKALPES